MFTQNPYIDRFFVTWIRRTKMWIDGKYHVKDVGPEPETFPFLVRSPDGNWQMYASEAAAVDAARAMARPGASAKVFKTSLIGLAKQLPSTYERL